MAELYSIVYQPEPSVYEPPYRFLRVPTDSANLVVGHGIEGDRKAGHNPRRQINIMSYETLEDLRAEGFKTDPGEMGEQLIVRGLDVMALEPGTQIQLGDEAVIELTKKRTGCSWFEQIQGMSREGAADRMGMLAMVVQSGVIRVGDPVTVLQDVRT
jgi:MOSC domain-containing protein YiiM